MFDGLYLVLNSLKGLYFLLNFFTITSTIGIPLIELVCGWPRYKLLK